MLRLDFMVMETLSAVIQVSYMVMIIIILHRIISFFFENDDIQNMKLGRANVSPFVVSTDYGFNLHVRNSSHYENYVSRNGIYTIEEFEVYKVIKVSDKM